MKKIKLNGRYGKGNFAMVENEDFEYLNKFKWLMTKEMYVYRHSKNKIIWMHREVMNCPTGLIVDHRFHNTLDNQKINLRICTNTENVKNRRKLRGVAWDNAINKFKAFIDINFKRKYLGKFDSAEEAGKKYDTYAVKHGYRMNFCNEDLIAKYMTI